MRRLAELVLRHRKLIVGLWAVIILAGGLSAGQASKRLKIDFSLPTEPGTKTANTIEREFGNGGFTQPYLVSVTAPPGQTVTGHEQEVARAFAATAASSPNLRVVDEAHATEGTDRGVFRTKDDRTAFALVAYPLTHTGSNGLTLPTEDIHTGYLTPMQVLVNADNAADVAEELDSLAGVDKVVVSTDAANVRNGHAVIYAIPHHETVNNRTIQPVKEAKSALEGDADVLGIAGIGADQIDFLNAVYGNAPYMLLLITLLTFVLLARGFRSVLLPLKAVLLNLLTLAATLGFMVLFWQHGFGSDEVFGVEPTGAITFWLPLMVFAFLYGLSMDYEVFILSRVREEYDNLGTTDGAVVEGIARTGRLVTSAALILFLAFVALSTGPGTDLKLFATALGFGILLDATIVRSLLVPALVSLFGQWNWWMPHWFAKALRVHREEGEVTGMALAD